MVRSAGIVFAVVGVVVLGGCSGDVEPQPIVSKPAAPAWQQALLPGPDGATGRLMVRDAASCDGRWFVVGAVADAAGGTRPAAWSSVDGSAWASMRVEAQTFYGRQNVLSSVACRQGRMAALGAKSGGAHGNPRTSSWREMPNGVLGEVTAPFELFGGPQAVNVARMDAGDLGWLISGNRFKGAAVWVSQDAQTFRLVEGAPELASDRHGQTWAFDGVDSPEGWLVVGGVSLAGRIDRDPLGWSSTDGLTWRRIPGDHSAAYEELHRVASVDGVAVAVGLRGAQFGAWRREGALFRAVSGFGTVVPGGRSGVRALTVVGGRLICVTSDGVGHAVWTSTDGGVTWGAVAVPVAVPARAEQIATVVGTQDRLLLAVDDGSGGEIYSAGSAW